MVNYLALGISLVVFGSLSILNFLNVFRVNNIKVIAVSFILFGLVSVVDSLNKMKRSTLFLISMVFNVGIILLIQEYFEILNGYDIILSSVLYILGGGFLLIFLQNTSEKAPLYFSLFFLILSFISLHFFDDSYLIQFANRITLILFDYWPIFLLIFGIVLVAGKPKAVN